MIQPDGKIVSAGFEFQFGPTQLRGCVQRWEPNGERGDFSFGGSQPATYNTSFNVAIYALALQPDGKIVAVGSQQFQRNGLTDFDLFIVRLTSAGQRDPAFNNGAELTISAGLGGLEEAVGVAIQPDGKIVVAGYCRALIGGNSFCTYRLMPNGAIDTSFGNNGLFPGQTSGINVGTATSMALMPDGKIVVGGVCGGQVCVERYTSTGQYDTTFGTGGSVLARSVANVGGLALQGDGSVVVAADCVLSSSPPDRGFCPVRIDRNGSVDPLVGQFTTQFIGWSTTSTAVLVQPDGH
ncbi:MAG: delta-60 repeat domain-containing protein, partial [Casimicrobium sp.]